MTVRQRAYLEVFHIPREAVTKDTVLSGLFDLRSLATTQSTLRAESGGYLRTRGVNDVLSWSWHKRVSTTGVLRVTLRPSRNYSEILSSGDLLYVLTSNVYGADGRMSLCLCLIDSVHENVVGESNGSTLINYEVNARDFTKILLNTKTVINPAFLQVNAVSQVMFNSALYETLTKTRSGSPCEMVLSVLDVFYNGEGVSADLVRKQWQTTDGVSLWSLVDLKNFVQAPMFGYNVPNPLDPGAFGCVWDMVRSLANSVVNEFFIDTRELDSDQTLAIRHAEDVVSSFLLADDVASQRATRQRKGSVFGDNTNISDNLSNVAIKRSVVALVHRQYPYDRDAFDALPECTVTAEETYTLNFTKSDDDVRNQFKIRTPSLPQLEQEYLYGLVINQKSQQLYGICEYDGETLYPFTSSSMSLNYVTNNKDMSIPVAAYDYYVNLLSVWHAYNERMLSGTWSGVYKPNIRVGMRLRVVTETDQHLRAGVKQRVFQAYVEGVSHSGTEQQGSATSTVNFVRGIFTSDDAKSDKYENALYWRSSGPVLRNNPYVIFKDTQFTVGGK